MREISFLRTLQHQNVVKLKDVIPKDGRLFLLFELMKQDLRQFINSKGRHNYKKYVFEPLWSALGLSGSYFFLFFALFPLMIILLFLMVQPEKSTNFGCVSSLRWQTKVPLPLPLSSTTPARSLRDWITVTSGD